MQVLVNIAPNRAPGTRCRASEEPDIGQLRKGRVPGTRKLLMFEEKMIKITK